MNIIDLTHPLEHGQDTFPWDPKLSIVPHGNTRTLKYNITQISMSTHQGTHVDAIYHFLDEGKTIDQMPLNWFFGHTHLLRIPKEAGADITVADFAPYEALLKPGARIIYETGWHREFGKEHFYSAFPSLTQEAGRYLADKGIRFLGMDTPTPSRDWYEMHHDILLPKEIVIVEALANLHNAPDEFIFAGFPLNIKGRDGSPIRAVAFTGGFEGVPA
ncbi:kynurenine formamidase [Filimonas zeae]|uniref:Polyketide cyclase n=1 Tax=Filimonas zeae TaxID=1737353 RepID=A0A917IYJ4_9BACT|nr:cyclase family protein [Filimonas zeae]MDR6339001.1 kynurenine formamidase [Filimonas zeae]GGH65579.1 polyketide cyclase [Filimonas zeae]